MWDRITFLFLNSTVGICEWIINFTPHFTGHMIAYPGWDGSCSMLVKGAPDVYVVWSNAHMIHSVRAIGGDNSLMRICPKSNHCSWPWHWDNWYRCLLWPQLTMIESVVIGMNDGKTGRGKYSYLTSAWFCCKWHLQAKTLGVITIHFLCPNALAPWY